MNNPLYLDKNRENVEKMVKEYELKVSTLQTEIKDNFYSNEVGAAILQKNKEFNTRLEVELAPFIEKAMSEIKSEIEAMVSSDTFFRR